MSIVRSLRGNGPPANSAGIIPAESFEAGHFHTGAAILKVVTTKFFIRFSGPSEVPAGW
jgi:hypothetical protein